MFRKSNSVFAARALSSSQTISPSSRACQIYTLNCHQSCRTATIFPTRSPPLSTTPRTFRPLRPVLTRNLSTGTSTIQRRSRPIIHHCPTINPAYQAPPKAESIRHLTMAVNFNDRDVLPDTIKPINYDISIYDIELGGNFGYQGTVSILSKIIKNSKEIVLNSHELKIHSAEVQLEHTKTQQAFVASNISYDAPRQRVTLSFPEEIPLSEKAVILIKFQGTINNDMAGFYRSKYKPTVPPASSVPKDGEHHVMFSTQFESRTWFPCSYTLRLFCFTHVLLARPEITLDSALGQDKNC